MQAEAFAWLDRWLVPSDPDSPLATLRAQIAEGAAERKLGRLEAQRAELDRRIAELRPSLRTKAE